MSNIQKYKLDLGDESYECSDDSSESLSSSDIDIDEEATKLLAAGGIIRDEESESIEDSDDIDANCPICYDKLQLPIKLNCCGKDIDYLCLKGILMSTSINRCCPLCRGAVSMDLLEKVKKEDLDNIPTTDNTNTDIIWCYHGRNLGFWEYDKRSNIEINNNYIIYQQDPDNYDPNTHLINIASINFIIDFKNNRQINQKTGAIRQISKKNNNIQIKGTAGVSGLI